MTRQQASISWEKCEALAQEVVEMSDDLMVWIGENPGEQLYHVLRVAKKSKMLDAGLSFSPFADVEKVKERVKFYLGVVNNA